MFSYQLWRQTCDEWFSADPSLLKSDLNHYPFTRLGEADKERIAGHEFYETEVLSKGFMRDGVGVLTAPFYFQKRSGAIRESALVLSPIFNLVTSAAAKHIASCKELPYDEDLRVFTLASEPWRGPGMYSARKHFNALSAEIDSFRGDYDCFLHTDIRDFCGSVSFAKMLAGPGLPDYEFLADLLPGSQHCLPLFNNSLDYYLPYVLFLNPIDNSLCSYLRKDSRVGSFKAIRICDDLFLLFNLAEGCELAEVTRDIVKTLASLLCPLGLVLNDEKTEWGPIDELRKPQGPKKGFLRKVASKVLAGKGLAGDAARRLRRAAAVQELAHIHRGGASWGNKETRRAADLLLACEFKDERLMKILAVREPGLYEYCLRYCVEGACY